MMFTSVQIKNLKDYGFSVGSKAYLYREYGASDEHIKRFVENALPMGVQGIDWLTDIYMKSARVGFSVDKGNKYNNPVYDLMKAAMKGTVEKWNCGEYKIFRKI